MRLPSPLVRSIAAVGLAAAAASPLAAQGALPPARQLIDKHIAAVGGKQAILAAKSAHMKGTFEVPSQGMSGEMEIMTQRPNMMFSKVNIPGIGEITTGFNGSVGWSMNPMQGPRVMTGKELDLMKEQTAESELRDASLLMSAETVEKTTMGGQECYKVKLVWKSGRTSYDCYSVANGLLVGQQMSQESPMGTIEVTTTFADYKDFGGVKRPATRMQEMMGMQQIMTVKSVTYDAVPASAFELPKEIKALVEKK